MTKNKTSVIVAQEIETATRMENMTADVLAASYIAIREKEKSLMADKQAIQAEVGSRLKNGELFTGLGVFRKEERRSYSWKVEAIKDFFGRSYAAYIKADDKLVRAKMETEPGLAKIANVTVTEALTFREE